MHLLKINNIKEIGNSGCLWERNWMAELTDLASPMQNLKRKETGRKEGKEEVGRGNVIKDLKPRWRDFAEE